MAVGWFAIGASLGILGGLRRGRTENKVIAEDSSMANHFMSWLRMTRGDAIVVAFLNDERYLGGEAYEEAFTEHFELSIEEADDAWRASGLRNTSAGPRVRDGGGVECVSGDYPSSGKSSRWGWCAQGLWFMDESESKPQIALVAHNKYWSCTPPMLCAYSQHGELAGRSRAHAHIFRGHLASPRSGHAGTHRYRALAGVARPVACRAGSAANRSSTRPLRAARRASPSDSPPCSPRGSPAPTSSPGHLPHRPCPRRQGRCTRSRGPARRGRPTS